MHNVEARREKRGLNLKVIALIAVVAAFTLFCVFNRDTVHVWPLGWAPLILVILLSFALGTAAGWLGRSLFVRKPRLAPDKLDLEEN